jgi:heme-degrading monooxygenase HmoA
MRIMYVIMWEFQPKAGYEEEFEQAYGPGGVWAELFQRADAYRGTELLHDTRNTRRYVSVDRWTSQAAYDEFRSILAGEYDAIDQQCALFTESEQLIGVFILPQFTHHDQMV